MGNVVLNLEMNKIMEMRNFYGKNLLDKNIPGSVFAAKTSACMITAYKSGKVLFQGNDSEKEAGRWGSTSASSKKPSSSHSKSVAKGDLPTGIGQMSAIGSDEVGTGDFFGPITVVAAYVKKENIPLLKELGVRDSKDLNDEKIIAIAKVIKDIIPFSLMTLKNEKYNQVQQSGMSQGKMKAILHNQAILNVLDKISPEKPEAILIDQFVQGSTYFQHLKSQKAIAKENVYFSTKAEGIHLAVAAASILARYAFIQYIDKLSEAAGFKIPKGAGAQVDVAAAKLIMSKGRDILPSFVKLHFANSDKAMALVNKKRN
ncbi:ribonuclease HIII [Bacillus sp. OV166]|uniref:ribonuclease HIII n=1 Tax=unclassified Bacillus (in: firmicutes) TaxID=185979 RepID=UPI000A2AA99D|nr:MULTISPECIES: ribonuclease HIII [unclassified Bacillus (in: firmicutes)]PGY10047.1 ribonuclease HIII [Bacillus sp. AFS031507]SMQ83334.1 ribonuclease HIII [Bacillus sp. OV166]